VQYVELIANKLRNSGRSCQEMSVAQQHVERMCFSLIVGAYSRNRYFGQQNVTQNLAAFNYAPKPFRAVHSECSC
jgi:hypothetical protein